MSAPIWFERPLIPDLAGDVRRRCTTLGPATEEDPYSGIEPAVAAVVGNAACNAEMFDRAPLLKVVGRTGIGVDSVDIAEASNRGIAVVNIPTAPTTSTAEHAVALMLAIAKDLRRAQLRTTRGEDALYAKHRGIELDGKTLGLLGFGRIARQVAQVGISLGMDVIAHDPFVEGSEFPSGVRKVETRREVLAMADVVSVHVPLTEETHHCIDAAALATMRAGSILVNSARGGLVDQDALLAALDSGHLVGAGLDVTVPEPLPADHPLLHRDNVIVTPHVATATPEARRRNFMGAFEQSLQVIAGDRPEFLVNPDVWDS